MKGTTTMQEAHN